MKKPGPSAAAREAMSKGSRETGKDETLKRLTEMGRRVRDATAELKDLQDRAAEKSAEIRRLTDEEMPDLMNRIGIDRVGVLAEGNHAAVDFRLQQAISANIAAGWDPKRKATAFAFLKRRGAESLIKAEVKAALPKGKLKIAQQLVQAAKKIGVQAELRESVNGQTLSAWLREVYASGASLSSTELETIGGYVGSVVRAVERRE